jgi:hypothetical protein
LNWHNESWVKLYTRRTAEWDDMSVMARGIGNELLKYAKNDGSLCRTKGRDPAMAVALVLRPKPDELEAVTSAAAELLDDGYLVVKNGSVWVKNYEDAQERRTYAAVKQQRYRERKEAETQESDGNKTGNTVTEDPLPPLPGSETRRDETRRDSNQPTQSPSAPLELVSSDRFVPDLDAAYDEYPRKEGKTRAMKKLKRDITTPAKYERFIAAVRNYARHVAGRPADKVKQFDSFVTCWEDYADGLPFVASAVPQSSRSLPPSTSVSDETRAARKF